MRCSTIKDLWSRRHPLQMSSFFLLKKTHMHLKLFTVLLLYLLRTLVLDNENQANPGDAEMLETRLLFHSLIRSSLLRRNSGAVAGPSHTRCSCRCFETLSLSLSPSRLLTTGPELSGEWRGLWQTAATAAVGVSYV